MSDQKKKNYDQRIKENEQEYQDKIEEAAATRVDWAGIAKASAEAAAERRDKEKSLWEETRRNALGR